MDIPMIPNIPNSTSLGLNQISLAGKIAANGKVSPIDSITSGVPGEKTAELARHGRAEGKPGGASQTGIQAAASQFEELFVSLMLKQMRETLDEGLFGKDSSDSLGAIFDMYMGKHLAASSPLGVGKAVSAYLKAGQQSE